VQNSTGAINYFTKDGNSLWPTDLTTLFGINTGSPSATLQVYGNYSVPPFTMGKSTQTMIQTYQPDYSLSFGDLTFDDYGMHYDISDLARQFSWAWYTDTAMILKGQYGSPKFLGIGTTNPTNAVQVGQYTGINSGEIRIGNNLSNPEIDFGIDGNAYLKFVDGNQAAGKSLTSDPNGNASWQPPSNIYTTDGTLSGDRDVEISNYHLKLGNDSIYIGLLPTAVLDIRAKELDALITDNTNYAFEWSTEYTHAKDIKQFVQVFDAAGNNPYLFQHIDSTGQIDNTLSVQLSDTRDIGTGVFKYHGSKASAEHYCHDDILGIDIARIAVMADTFKPMGYAELSFYDSIYMRVSRCYMQANNGAFSIEGNVQDTLKVTAAGKGLDIFSDPYKSIIKTTADSVSISSKLQIADGTQGAGKALTSDADGNATWQASIDTTQVWLTHGNANTISNGAMIGTTDSDPLIFKFNDNPSGIIHSSNTAFGSASMNIGLAYFAVSNTTSIGALSLRNVTTGAGNTALGHNAGATITEGSNNTFLGYRADVSSDSSISNSIAIGFNAKVDANNKLFVTDQITALHLGNVTGYNTAGNVLTTDGTNQSFKPIVSSGAIGDEPVSPYLGQFYFDTTLTKMKFWNGFTWAIITSTP